MENRIYAILLFIIIALIFLPTKSEKVQIANNSLLTMCQSLYNKSEITENLITDDFRKFWNDNQLSSVVIRLTDNKNCSIVRGWSGKFFVSIKVE